MEYKQFYVKGLFGLYNHTIDFSKSKTPKDGASVVMLYGKNGIGKTTILRMIDGIMSLNFSEFRKVKFEETSLEFSNNDILKVKSFYRKNGDLQYLEVSFKNLAVKLHPQQRGGLNNKEKINEQKLVDAFEIALEDFSFEFIDTERLMKKNLKEEMLNEERRYIQGKIVSRKKVKESTYLVDKVKRFITESQVYNTRYFTSEEPALFDKILYNIENPITFTSTSLKKRISSIVKFDKDYETKRLGLAQEKWDKRKLNLILNNEQKKKTPSIQKLTVINSYLEVIESRLRERVSLAERLLNFERILNNFLSDKSIIVSKEKGFEIESINGDNISETKLSTGEYHLLYLSVLTLCTTVMGTVIAIDEPEMSMHVNWQNNLVNALVRISSKANPQFIFATHSPDIAANYSNSMQTEFHEQN